MKKITLILVLSAAFTSCQKSEITEDVAKPVLVKVEAVHADGEIVSTDVAVVR